MQKKGKIKITIKRLLRACLIDQTLLVGRSSEEQERTDILYREIVLSKGLGIIINNKVTFLINIVNQKIHPTIYCIKLLLSFFIFCTSLTIVLSINIWFKWEGEEDKFLFLFGDLIKKKILYKNINIFQQQSLLDADERLSNPFSDLKTPMSAGYLQKKTFFPNFPKNRLKLKRSESDRTLPPVGNFTSHSGQNLNINWQGRRSKSKANCLTDWADELDGNQSDFSLLSDLIAYADDLVTAESPAGCSTLSPVYIDLRPIG